MRKRHSLISFGAGLVLMLIGAATPLAQPAYAQVTSNEHGKPLAVLDTQLPTATPTPSVTGTPPTATSTNTGTPPTATPTISPTRTATPTATRPTATPSAGGCWSVVGSPSLAYHGLYDVAAISSSDVWAVGVYVVNGAYRTLTEHWDGTAWSIVPSPNPGSLNQFFGVAAAAPNDVWAVGMSGTSDFSPTLIEHWDGSTWSVVTPPVNGILREVTAISSNDVWAVGTDPTGNNRGLILHWNGSVWQHVPSPSPGVTSALSGLAAAGPDDIWAVGTMGDGNTNRTLTMHWNGSTWQTVSSPNFDEYANVLNNVTAVGPNDFWAVGHSNVNGHLILHWNGSAWEITPVPGIAGTPLLNDVVALDWDDIWAVGRVADGAGGALFEHWNGSAWSVVNNPWLGQYAAIEGIAAVGPLDLWAVGGPESPVTEHYGTFCPTPTPSPIPPTLTPTVTGTPPTVRPSNTPTGGVPPRTSTSVPSPSSTNPAASATVTSTSSTSSPTDTRSATVTGTPSSTSSTSSPTNTRSATVTGTPTIPPYTPTAMPSATIGAPTACAITFADVPEDSTFSIYIRCLACKDIISGYSDGSFRPGNAVTRGQIAKIVSNAAGFSEDRGPRIYEDVPVGSPFYDWVNRLSQHGYMGGYECGIVPEQLCIPPNNYPYFRPNAPATRGQISKIVSNAAGINDAVGDQMFQDVPPSNSFYTWIQRLAGRGFIGGYPCGGANEPCSADNLPYFRPNNNATRGQVSKIVSNTFFPNCETPSGTDAPGSVDLAGEQQTATEGQSIPADGQSEDQPYPQK